MEKNKGGERKAMLRDAGILFAVTLLSGLLLGFVYELTKEPIRLQEEKAVQEACQAVFAQADSFQEREFSLSEELERELLGEGVSIGTLYDALDASGAHLGYVVESTSSEGYGGDITLYIGVTDQNHLNGISILSISETPGLGMRAPEVLVPQFADKEAGIFSYTKSGSSSPLEIDAISGATITTRAVTSAVNGGLKALEGLLEGGM